MWVKEKLLKHMRIQRPKIHQKQIFFPHGPTSLLTSLINYGIIIKSISTLMYTVWHVDKYKITFKLVINHWTNEIL